MVEELLFQSFFMGGFECSCHRLRSGRRLDMIAATEHDKYATVDYLRLQEQGIYTARDGIRWPLIESVPGCYNFSSLLSMLHAARHTGMQVIWDLCHYGYPDDIDIFKPEFVRRFAKFAGACAEVLINEGDTIPFITPINEISFWSWGGGDVTYLNPFAQGRGFELKVQLVRATIEAIEAIWNVAPEARIVQPEPVIYIAPNPTFPDEYAAAEAYTLAQYEAWDMLCGHLWPQLGGDEKYLDIIGVNYYPRNQWFHRGPTITPQHPCYRPFRAILAEVYQRFGRPLFIAETGTEGEARPAWLRYICGEVCAALKMGTPIEGICLYPVVNHPGWDDDRHCHNGLWDYPDEIGEREIYGPLASELQRQRQAVERIQHLKRDGFETGYELNINTTLVGGTL